MLSPSSPTSFTHTFLSPSPPPLSQLSPPSRTSRISPPLVSASPSYTCAEESPRLHRIPRRSSATASLYEILEVPIGATSQDIKSAYRRLARICHPDVAGTDRTSSSSSSADEFMKIHAAYCTLSDPEKRSVYDRRILRRSRPLTVGTSGLGSYVGRNWETDQCW